MADGHDDLKERRSLLALIVVRLRVGARECFLLREHPKWGDWGLIGGHVEPSELDDWARAARREAEEEMAPLLDGSDFALDPVALARISWGPEPSRSAGGAPTHYEAKWFALRFKRDPAACLRRLPLEHFVLIERSTALTGDPPVTTLLQRLDHALPGGLDALPPAWSSPIDEKAIPPELTRVPPRPVRRAAS